MGGGAGTAGYLTAVSLLGLSLAALVRSSAGAITLLVAVVFVAPPLLPLIPFAWIDTAAHYVPSVAGTSLSTADGSGTLSTAAAALTLTGWVLLPLLAGAVLMQRRDA